MYSREGMETSTQFYVTEESNSSRKEGSTSHDTAEEDDGVSAWRGGRWRQMEVLDLVSFAQRNETLRRSAAAHSPGQSANAHDPIAGVRAGRDSSPARLRAGATKGRIFTDRTGAAYGASAAPVLCVGEVAR